MSIQAVAWVLEHSAASLADRLVLIAIANHADARGWNAWPAVPLIAAEARVDRATVFRSIAALEELGEIHVERRPGRPNRYGIRALMGSQDATGEGSQDATGGVASTRQRGRSVRPEPSEPSMNRRGRARKATDTTPLIPAGPVPLPPAIDPDTRRRGAEYIRALRRGERVE